MLMNVPAGRVCTDDSGCYANETCCEEKGVCEVATSPGACGENSSTFELIMLHARSATTPSSVMNVVDERSRDSERRPRVKNSPMNERIHNERQSKGRKCFSKRKDCETHHCIDHVVLPDIGRRCADHTSQLSQLIRHLLRCVQAIPT